MKTANHIALAAVAAKHSDFFIASFTTSRSSSARVAALTLFNQCRNVFVLRRLGGKRYRNPHRGGSDHVFGKSTLSTKCV